MQPETPKNISAGVEKDDQKKIPKTDTNGCVSFATCVKILALRVEKFQDSRERKAEELAIH